jgi:enoyl-CoA hydratase
MPHDLLYDESGGIGTITLNRPEARNALTARTYAALEAAVRTSSARCLIVTGAGPAFCSGDDVKQVMAADGPRIAAELRQAPRLTPAAQALLTTDIPVIAAVNGPAVGWGMELALMADVRIASTRARFGELFVKRGLCCDVAGLARLAGLVGREHAAELLFTGRMIDAAEARELRLVSRVVEPEQLLDIARALAQQIAANPPLALRSLKAGLRTALDPDWEDLGRWVSARLGELFQTADHREGVAAFLEKREPRFVGG